MPSESLNCRSNAARMQFECPECGSIAVRISRMRLECSSNVPNAARMQFECPECGSNAVRMSRPGCKNVSRMLTDSISIFSIRKESSWNALRMPSESLDCRSYAARMQLECLDQDDARMHSNAVGIFRLPLECGSNGVRMSWMRLEWSSNIPTKMQECISIAAGNYYDISVQKII